jgi:hypothetical protein
MATDTWTAPSLDAVFICCDEDNTTFRMCRYVDFLAEIDPEFWPRDAGDFDLLMWTYNAEPARSDV